MNPLLLLEIIQLAASIIKSQTSDAVDAKIDEAAAITRIVVAGRQAYQDSTGEPLDESKIREQEHIE